MLTLPPSVRIFLATEPTDMRKGVDGLSALVRARGQEVYSGHLFLFVSRKGDRVKILSWDRRSAELLRPLYDRMVVLVPTHSHVNADETTLKIQQKGGCHTGWMWTFCAGEMLVFSYSNSRSGETPKRILGDTDGILQVGGHTGYNHVTTRIGERAPGVGHMRGNRRSTSPTCSSASKTHQCPDSVSYYR